VADQDVGDAGRGRGMKEGVAVIAEAHINKYNNTPIQLLDLVNVSCFPFFDT
jgi:hypothetical protein